jgi:hypothetical protein
VAKTISLHPADVPAQNIVSPFAGSPLNAELWLRLSPATRPCLGARLLVQQADDRVELRVDRVDPADLVLQQLDRGGENGAWKA